METSVKVQGLNKVQRMLNKASAEKALVVGIKFGVTKLRQVIEKYPATSSANEPNESGRWYERGYGTRYRRKDGSLGGRLTSHPLKDGWQTKVYEQGHIRGIVENVAKYAPYVQGSEKLQARIHATRGWKRLPEEGKKLAPKVTKEVIRAFKETMNK